MQNITKYYNLTKHSIFQCVTMDEPSILNYNYNVLQYAHTIYTHNLETQKYYNIPTRLPLSLRVSPGSCVTFIKVQILNGCLPVSLCVSPGSCVTFIKV